MVRLLITYLELAFFSWVHFFVQKNENYAIVLIFLEIQNRNSITQLTLVLLTKHFYARFGQKRKWILERGFIENTYYVAHFGLGMTWNVEHLTCSDSFSPPLKYLSEFGDKNTFHHSLEFL